MMRGATACVLAWLMGLAGCVQLDPYTKAGVWQPGGVNNRNIAAMAANPADLLQGRGSRGANGTTATSAVQRLLSGTPTPLPSLNATAAPGSGGSNATASNVGAGASPSPASGTN